MTSHYRTLPENMILRLLRWIDGLKIIRKQAHLQ